MRACHHCVALSAAFVALTLSGCSWGHFFAADPASSHGPGAAAFSPGTAKPGWHGSPHNGPGGQGGPPGNGPNGNGFQPASYPGAHQGAAPGAANEQYSMLAQRLASLDDDRRAQVARIQHLESQLRDKDKALVQAALEIQEATGQMAKTREELQRWKLEMEGLRGKLRSVERDNKTTLETIIQTLEQFLDRERDVGARTPDLTLTPLGPTPLKK